MPGNETQAANMLTTYLEHNTTQHRHTNNSGT
jgi:hypothetical protein